MAFRYYDAEKVINGKKYERLVEDLLWHGGIHLCAEGGDQFGGGTKAIPMEW